MKNKIIGTYSFKTDVGKIRITNEDQALALTNCHGDVMLLVCDGMGGQNHGDLASRIAKEIFSEEFLKAPKFAIPFMIKFWLKSTIKKANSVVYDESVRNNLYKGMGTTVTIAILSRGYLTIGQIGDSRAYVMTKNGKLKQLTDDQTYVAYLYRSGQIKEEDMKTHPKRHVLLNALGVYPSVSFDLLSFKYNGEPLLLCSDGLYNNVNSTDIETILRLDDTPQQKCDELISLSNANGGSDNIAIVYWEASIHGY